MVRESGQSLQSFFVEESLDILGTDTSERLGAERLRISVTENKPSKMVLLGSFLNG